jgi:hypothetical protein
MAVRLRRVTLRDLQPDAMPALDAAYARAVEVIEPDLLALVTDRITVTLTDARPACTAESDRDRAVCAVIDQMLMDVAGLDDRTVQHAASFFPDGALADLVMASYIIEARTRLAIMGDRLLGGVT